MFQRVFLVALLASQASAQFFNFNTKVTYAAYVGLSGVFNKGHQLGQPPANAPAQASGRVKISSTNTLNTYTFKFELTGAPAGATGAFQVADQMCDMYVNPQHNTPAPPAPLSQLPINPLVSAATWAGRTWTADATGKVDMSVDVAAAIDIKEFAGKCIMLSLVTALPGDFVNGYAMGTIGRQTHAVVNHIATPAVAAANSQGVVLLNQLDMSNMRVWYSFRHPAPWVAGGKFRVTINNGESCDTTAEAGNPMGSGGLFNIFGNSNKWVQQTVPAGSVAPNVITGHFDVADEVTNYYRYTVTIRDGAEAIVFCGRIAPQFEVTKLARLATAPANRGFVSGSIKFSNKGIYSTSVDMSLSGLDVSALFRIQPQRQVSCTNPLPAFSGANCGLSHYMIMAPVQPAARVTRSFTSTDVERQGFCNIRLMADAWGRYTGGIDISLNRHRVEDSVGHAVVVFALGATRAADTPLACGTLGASYETPSFTKWAGSNAAITVSADARASVVDVSWTKVKLIFQGSVVHAGPAPPANSWNSRLKVWQGTVCGTTAQAGNGFFSAPVTDPWTAADTVVTGNSPVTFETSGYDATCAAGQPCRDTTAVNGNWRSQASQQGKAFKSGTSFSAWAGKIVTIGCPVAPPAVGEAPCACAVLGGNSNNWLWFWLLLSGGW